MATAAERAFDRLERTFTRAWVRRDPLRAVDAGLTSGFDGRVPDAGAACIEDEIKLLKRTQQQLDRINVEKLPEPRRQDADLLRRMLEHKIVELDVVRQWESIPVAPRLIGECLYQLVVRNYAPLKLRLRRIMTRIDQLPKMIEQSKSRLRRPVKVLIENELETITRLPAFFHNLKEIGRLNLQETPMNAMARQVYQLQNNVEQYYNWLIIEVLSGCPSDYAIPPAHYAALMKARGLTVSPDAMLRRTNEELERLRHRLREQGRRLKRRIPLEDLRDRLKSSHPNDFDGVLKYLRDQVNRTRDFVARSGFATLPAKENLYVVEMPTYLRHTLPLSHTAPPCFVDGKIEGYFMVSPGDCDSSRLKEFSFPALAGMTIREGYPGRHLQQAIAGRHASLIRRLYQAPETARGWMFYSEERMREMGYDDSPQGHFLFTLEQISRAVRAVIDLRIHAGRMSVQEAVNLLIDEVGMDRIVAEAEVRRILITPTESLDAVHGIERFRELRQETKARLKAGFDERAFHDTILGAGALSMPVLRRHLSETLKAPKVEPKPKPPRKGPKAKPRAIKRRSMRKRRGK